MNFIHFKQVRRKVFNGTYARYKLLKGSDLKSLTDLVGSWFFRVNGWGRVLWSLWHLCNICDVIYFGLLRGVNIQELPDWIHISHDLVLSDFGGRQGLMSQLYKGSSWHSRESLVIKEVGGDLADSGLSRLYPLAASVAAEGASQPSWVVWSEGLFIDWFENSDVSLRVAHCVGATGAIPSQSRLYFLTET